MIRELDGQILLINIFKIQTIMKRVYETGVDANEISCAVKIGTVGVAYSEIKFARFGGQWAKIKQSRVGSGNIASFKLGKAKEVRNSYIIITTIIDFSLVPKNEWEDHIKRIYTEYSFDGGILGKQDYHYDSDDIIFTPNGYVSITKPIKLL